MPTEYERWIGHQVKMRLAMDRILLKDSIIPQVPQDLWIIITDYVHEDPRVVDAIMHHEYKADIPGARYQNWLETDLGTEVFHDGYHSMSLDEWRIIHSNGALDCDGTYARGGNLFCLILMLPRVDSLGNEYEDPRIPEGLVQLREAIYTSLNSA